MRGKIYGGQKKERIPWPLDRKKHYLYMLTKGSLPLRTGTATQLQEWMIDIRANLGTCQASVPGSESGGKETLPMVKVSSAGIAWINWTCVSLWDQVECSMVNWLRYLQSWAPLPQNNSKQSIATTFQHGWIILKEGEVRDCIQSA